MTPHPDWPEILLRLALAALAGSIIGLNRGEHGHPAGLRTTLLVCVAAALAMVEANLLLLTHGKAADGFVNIDPMRLPLGILSGIGFIGAGAIVRKDDMVQGVTTAATIWYVTVMGLCIGSGQILLGMIALGLGVLALTVLKGVEDRAKIDRRAHVRLLLAADGPGDSDLQMRLELAGCRVASWRVAYSREPQTRELVFAVHIRRPAEQVRPPALIAELAVAPGVLAVEWSG